MTNTVIIKIMITSRKIMYCIIVSVSRKSKSDVMI